MANNLYGVAMLRTLLLWAAGAVLVLASASVSATPHTHPHPGHGPCRLLHDIMADFKLDNYLGVWYPLLGWSNTQEGNVRDKCSKETISHDQGNITITEESLSDRSGPQSFSHHAWLDRPNEGKLTIWMFHAIKVPFWVVDTDYKHWAVVYSCTGDHTEYLKTLLVMGRGRDFAKLWKDPDAKKNIRKSLRRSNLLRLRDLTTVDQDDCSN